MSLDSFKLALIFVRLRWVWLSLALALTLFFGFEASKLTFNFSPDNIYLSTDPAYQFYSTDFIEAFGERANVCIVAIDGDAKEVNTQKALKNLHKDLEKVEDVKSVRSLASTEMYVSKNGIMQMLPVLGDDLQQNQVMLERARKDEMMLHLLIGERGNAPTLIVQLPRHLGDQAATDKVVIDIEQVLSRYKAEYPSLKFHVTGTPVLQKEAIATLKGDQMLFIPLVLLLMSVLLWLSFHSLRGVLLPFLATGSATLWTLGWLVLRGHSLDIVNNKLIVLLLVIGTSCAVQLLARFQDELSASRRKKPDLDESTRHNEVVAGMVLALSGPCLFTTTTAALGFGAVSVSKIDIIQNFGFDAAFGVMVSYVTTMLWVPAFLRILTLPKPTKNRFLRFIKQRWSLDHFLGALAHFSMRFSGAIITISAILMFAGLWIAKDIRADQRLASELPENSASVRALHFIEENLTGIMPFDIVFEGSPEKVMEPSFIRSAAALEAFAAEHELKPTVRSYSDILYSTAKSLSSLENEPPVHQWSDEKIAQIMMLFEMGEPQFVEEAKRDFLSKDGRFYRIQGLLKDANTEVLGEFRKQLKIRMEQSPIQGVKAHLAGSAMISSFALSHMITTLIASLIVAIITIFLLVWFLLRSLRFAFIILLPNLIPIVTTVAFMQVYGVTLRVATVMTFSMALGIAVDASIYLVTRFREEAILHHLHSEDPLNRMYQLLIERTMRGSGRPVVYTTLMLLAGFSVLGLSEFAAIRDFAILASVTLATALIVDLLLWPALIVKVKPKLTFVKN